MQQIVFGCLAGLDQGSIEIDVGKGQVRVYPRQELDVSLEWLFDNMGKRVACILRDGIVVQVKTFR